MFCDGVYGFHGHDAATGDAEEVFGVEFFCNYIKRRVYYVFLPVEGDQIVALVFGKDVGDG